MPHYLYRTICVCAYGWLYVYMLLLVFDRDFLNYAVRADAQNRHRISFQQKKRGEGRTGGEGTAKKRPMRKITSSWVKTRF